MELIPNWPAIQLQLSHLCQFVRNKSWRDHVIFCTVGRFARVEVLLRSFTASLVKWRYETAAKVCAQLSAVRIVCEQFIVPEMFQNTQERLLISAVVDACHDVLFYILYQV